jgi:Conjugative transposon protein TcpC
MLRGTEEPLWLTRLRGGLPRLCFFATLAVLCACAVVGVRRPAASRSTTVGVSSYYRDAAAEGLAQAFARAYLSLDPVDSGGRERQLARFGLPGDVPLDDRAGRQATSVSWTAVAASQHTDPRTALVTVAADDRRHTTYLAVTVTRSRDGRLYVSAPPAIVGAPAVAQGRLSVPQLEVDDRALQAVAGRALRHYLAGGRADLAADLAPRAQVALPRTALRLADVQATTWVSPGRRIAVVVLARAPSGMQLTLRYELEVVRLGDRWLVRSVQVNPLDREDRP